MGAVYFYHLTRTSLELTLPVLLQKALQVGWTIEVRGPTDEVMEKLDASLWQYPEDGFLPHVLGGADHEGVTPILLSTRAVTPRRECLMSVHGADFTVDEIRASARSCVVFDGHDPDALSTARTQWKTWADAGIWAQYWSEDSGSWVKKAEANAAD